MAILCFGVVRANTLTPPTISRSCCLLIRSIARPVKHPLFPVPTRSPSARAIDSAVSSASPVIITTCTPPVCRRLIASATPLRGGSSIAWNPTNTRFDLSLVPSEELGVPARLAARDGGALEAGVSTAP